MSEPLVPSRIDREALERILQRAAELQAQERDIGEGLTSDEVIKLGDEVGIPGQYLRQAMLEERSRVAARTPEGALGRVVGPVEVQAGRVVRGDPEAAERALLEWMQKNELLVVQRQQPGRIAWERLTGVQAAMRRGIATFEGAKARFMLARADVVRATVVPLEAGYCHVSLSAELRSARGGFIGGAVTLGAAGTAGTVVLASLNALAAVAAAPVVLGWVAAWFALRAFRPVGDRTLLGLERALDYVEGHAIKPAHQLPERGPGLLEFLSSEVRRALAAGPTPPAQRTPRKR